VKMVISLTAKCGRAHEDKPTGSALEAAQSFAAQLYWPNLSRQGDSPEGERGENDQVDGGRRKLLAG
jgi:hypothetical protein